MTAEQVSLSVTPAAATAVVAPKQSFRPAASAGKSTRQ
jgi:hypothetical protein